MESSNPTTASPQAKDQAQARPHCFGIQNGLIYWGIVVLMATLLLWLGVELAKRIEWFLPYSGGLGLSLVAGGWGKILTESEPAMSRLSPMLSANRAFFRPGCNCSIHFLS
jgi:hypothetical protein